MAITIQHVLNRQNSDGSFGFRNNSRRWVLPSETPDGWILFSPFSRRVTIRIRPHSSSNRNHRLLGLSPSIFIAFIKRRNVSLRPNSGHLFRIIHYCQTPFSQWNRRSKGAQKEKTIWLDSHSINSGARIEISRAVIHDPTGRDVPMTAMTFSDKVENKTSSFGPKQFEQEPQDRIYRAVINTEVSILML